MVAYDQYANPHKRDKFKEKFVKDKKQPTSFNWDAIAALKKLTYGRDNNYVYSVSEMRRAGLEYTGNEDNARCHECGFEKCGWTTNMDPIQIHIDDRPDCPYVTEHLLTKSLPLVLYTTTVKIPTKSMTASVSTPSSSSSSSSSSTTTTTTSIIRSASISNEQESPLKRKKIEVPPTTSDIDQFSEASTVQQIRRRTFSHWPHRTTPSRAQMIEAGFFNCNVGDRVICIYCNLICQQWTPHTDDPCEVHMTISPKCIYVKSKLLRRESGSIVIVNESSAGAASNNFDQVRCNELVHTVACHAAYSELPKRMASFVKWPEENLPSSEELVKAGFFYTGTKNVVTCFYCNGSLQNWGPNDNPTIEHARWFPHCAYAKQLCGDDLYRKIQESKRVQQERSRSNNEARDRTGGSGNSNGNSTQLSIPDESTLSRLVAARLDLPISQRLLLKKFKLSIIKRCWEDQLRLKLDDFVSESDLHMACIILQKQIEHIDGKKENIVIPSVRMRKIREEAEREQAEAHPNAQNSASAMVSDSNTPTAKPNNADIEMTTTSQSLTNESASSIDSTSKSTMTSNKEGITATKSTTNTSSEKENATDSSPANPCVLCLSDERRLACIPCGHLAACVPCGHSLRSCPICRREIEAFVRIYI